MTHEEMSLHTRQAMSCSLKKYMEKKPLPQITVSEICADCGVNRKTFYYHFQDIYDLLHWMLDQEALNIVKQFDLLRDYEQAIRFIIDYVDANSHILNCAYDTVGREGMKRFFFADFKSSVSTIIDGMEKEEGCPLAAGYKRFLADFYINALSGILLDWFMDRSVRTREEMAVYTAMALKSSVRSAVRESAGASAPDSAPPAEGLPPHSLP